MDNRTNCAHCEAPIVDPTTQVVHGPDTYCCANCSAAMEQRGMGTDPQSPRHENDIRCGRCTCPIVHDRTMETDDAGQIYCCRNCREASKLEVR